MRRACVVYSVNTLAQETALLALDDQSISRGPIPGQGKTYLYRKLTRLGLPWSCTGNFVMIKASD